MDPGTCTHTLFLYFSFTSLPPHYMCAPASAVDSGGDWSSVEEKLEQLDNVGDVTVTRSAVNTRNGGYSWTLNFSATPTCPASKRTASLSHAMRRAMFPSCAVPMTTMADHHLHRLGATALHTMSESLSLHFAIILWFVFVFVEPPAASNAADEDACPP